MQAWMFVVCLVLICLSVITTTSYASTREKKYMYASMVFCLTVITLILVKFGFLITLFGGAFLIITLVYLRIVIKNANKPEHDISD